MRLSGGSLQRVILDILAFFCQWPGIGGLAHRSPAKEDQATDRAYRIGQQKDVHVYCPLAVAQDFKTFDVKLDELLTRKRALATDMLRPAGDISMLDLDLDDILPPGVELLPDVPVTLDVLERMNGRAFEGLAAVLWRKQGFETQLTPASDAGVDVVGIRGDEGVLIQCKSSTRSRALGWEAVRDVQGGADIYADQHPMVRFKKVGLTNQRFNATAKARAKANRVLLIEQAELWSLVERYQVRQREISVALGRTL
jgi:Holliday junction resolvase